MDDLFEAVDLAVDTDPLKLRDALFAVLSMERYEVLDPRLGDLIVGGADTALNDNLYAGTIGGYNAALANVRQAIRAALGIQEGSNDG